MERTHLTNQQEPWNHSVQINHYRDIQLQIKMLQNCRISNLELFLSTLKRFYLANASPIHLTRKSFQFSCFSSFQL